MLSNCFTRIPVTLHLGPSNNDLLVSHYGPTRLQPIWTNLIGGRCRFWPIALQPCLRIRRMSDPEPKLPLWQGIIVFVAAAAGLPLLMLLLLWIVTWFL